MKKIMINYKNEYKDDLKSWQKYNKLEENLIFLMLFTSADASLKKNRFEDKKSSQFFNEMFKITGLKSKEIIITYNSEKVKLIDKFRDDTLYLKKQNCKQQVTFFNSLRNSIAHGNFIFTKGNHITFYSFNRLGYIDFHFKIKLHRLSNLRSYVKTLILTSKV